jgi:hypothetical protein
VLGFGKLWVGSWVGSWVVAGLPPVAKGVIPTLGVVQFPSFRAVGDEGCGSSTKGFLLYARAVARVAASADRFARTPALTCSVEAAPWFSQTCVLAKVTASPLARKVPYR